MYLTIINNLKNIVAIFMVAMFFSCVNNVKEVKDFLADKNLPVGESENVRYVYKDSGKVVTRLNTPLLYDFSNRKEHPYSEYPEGVVIVTIDKTGTDSTTISGDYARSYTKTSISEIIGNVVVYNHTEKTKLETSQLYWDQKINYFFTEKEFKLTLDQDTIYGTGFESKHNLQNWVMKKTSGELFLKEE
ncbi:LPS export ABC transporter periplasmic protein LptC [Flavicella sediminum]|uniref:LPS export ABC transporter periplasmic protein LptC n=1 Tax=Flavicella sediminum TaxID=2585141 RepID=UPI001FB7DAEF|nr:LPS export ABC transporter periplasmic protein LptC [Flavicella sediminum]